MAKIFWFDLETTGVNPAKHGIHQIAGRIEIDGKLMESFDIRVRPNPKAIIDPEALKTSNVTEEQVMAYQPFEEGYKQLLRILGTYVDKFNKVDKFHMAGYNIQAFDGQFLRGFFLQNGDQYFGSWFWPNTIDVYVLAGEQFMATRHEFADFKLKTVARKLGIQIEEGKLHDGDYDIEITQQVYQMLRLLRIADAHNTLNQAVTKLRDQK